MKIEAGKIIEHYKRTKKMLLLTKVTVIPIVIGALGTVPQNLEKRLDELENETIQTTGQRKSARRVSRVLETRKDLQPIRLQ